MAGTFTIHAVQPPIWQQLAACNRESPAAFYPPIGAEKKHERLARERVAKSICAGCSVRSLCLDQAVANDERYGIWGGLTADERRSLGRSA